jgi:hypothetical protein
MADGQDTTIIEGKPRDAAGEEARRLNVRLDRMWYEGRTNHERWVQIFKRGLNYLYDNQLAEKVERKGFDRVQANNIFPAAMQELSLLAQRRPMIKAMPMEPGDAEGAAFWESALQWQFDEGLLMPQLLLRGALDAKICGHWAAVYSWQPRAKWNRDERRWDGEVRARLLRPECVGVDPHANPDRLEQGRFVYIYEQRRTEELLREMPDVENLIRAAARAEGEAGGDDTFGDSAMMTALPWTGPTGGPELDATPVTGESDDPESRPTEEGLVSTLLSAVRDERRDIEPTDEQDETEPLPQYVWVLEIWFADESESRASAEAPRPIEQMLATGEVRLADDENQNAVHELAASGEILTEGNWPIDRSEWDEPEYPHGRHIIRIGRGQTGISSRIVVDEPWGEEMWPVAIGLNAVLPHTWHGLNGVEIGRGMQDLINDCAAHIANYVKQFSDPIVKVEENSLQGAPENRNVASRIAGHAGAIWKCIVNRSGGVTREPPPPIGAGLFDSWKMFADEHRSAMGMEAIGLGKQTKDMTASEAIRAETNSRMRTAMQSLLADMFTVRSMQIVHQFCASGWSAGQMVRIVGDEQKARVAAVMEGDLDARFDLKLEVGTSLPFDRERRKAEAKDLFALLGPVYLPDLLDAYEVKNKQRILDQLPIFQQAQAIIEQQQAMAEQAVAGGPDAGQPGQPGQPGQQGQPTGM